MRYGMVIDLKKCVGCMGCTIACKTENMLPPGVFWHIVKDQEFGEFPSVMREFLSIPCMHCKNAPCVDICPTGASYSREDGIVLIDQETCIGCGYCIEACPYGVRTMNREFTGFFGDDLTPVEEMSKKKHKAGVVGKCTFCFHLLDKGKEPACVRTCIGKARYFGDIDNLQSEVAQLIRARKGFQLKKELETDPAVYYLPS